MRPKRKCVTRTIKKQVNKKKANEGNVTAKRKRVVKEKNVYADKPNGKDVIIPYKRRGQRNIVSNNEQIASLNLHKLAVGLNVLGENKGKAKLDDVEGSVGDCTTNYNRRNTTRRESDILPKQTQKVVTEKVRSTRATRLLSDIASDVIKGDKQPANIGNSTAKRKLAVKEKNVYEDDEDDDIPLKRRRQRNIMSDNQDIASPNSHKLAVGLTVLEGNKGKGKVDNVGLGFCTTNYSRHDVEEYEYDNLSKLSKKVMTKKARSRRKPRLQFNFTSAAIIWEKQQVGEGIIVSPSKLAGNKRVNRHKNKFVATADVEEAAGSLLELISSKKVDDGKRVPPFCPSCLSCLERQRIEKAGSAAEPMPTISTDEEITGLNSSKENDGKILPLSSPARIRKVGSAAEPIPPFSTAKEVSAAEPIPTISTTMEVTGLDSSKDNDGETPPLSSPARNTRLYRRRIGKIGSAAEPIPTISTAKEVTGLNSSKENDGKTLPLSSPTFNTRLLRRRNDGIGSKQPELEKNISKSVLPQSDVRTTEKSRLLRRRIEKGGPAPNPIPTISTAKEVTGLNSSKENDGKTLPLSSPACNTQLLRRRNDGIGSKRPEQEKNINESALPQSDVRTTEKSRLHGRRIEKSVSEPIPTISAAKEVTGLNSSKEDDGKTLPLSSNTRLLRRKNDGVGPKQPEQEKNIGEPVLQQSDVRTTEKSRLHRRRIEKAGSTAEPIPTISTAKEVTGLNSYKEKDGKTLPLSSPACNTQLLQRKYDGVGSKRPEQEKNIGEPVLPKSDVQTSEKSRLHKRRIEKAGPAPEPIPTISTAKEVTGLNSSGLNSYKESVGKTLPLSSPACNTRRKNDGVGSKRPEQEKNIGESVLPHFDVQTTEKSRLQLHRRRIEKAGPAAEPMPTISTAKEVTGLNSTKVRNDAGGSKRPEQRKTTGESVLHQSDVRTTEKATDGDSQSKRSGKNKTADSHTRNIDKRKIIPLNDKFQPISDDSSFVISDFKSFLGTLARDCIPLIYASWHKVPFKVNLWEFVKKKYIISEQGKPWVMRTIRDAWKVYKFRIKKNHYTAYDNDDERIKNRPDDIPLEEFMALLAHWGSAKVKEFAAKISAANRKTAQTSKKTGNESGEQVMGGGKSRGLNSLANRLAQIKKSKDAYIEELTAKIKQKLLEEVDETVEQKVKQNMGLLVEKLSKSKPDFTSNRETSSEDDSFY